MSQSTRLLDLALIIAGVALVAGGVTAQTSELLFLGSGFFLIGSSTVVVLGGLATFTGEAIGEDENIDQDTGWLIGKLENVLVLTFVAVGEWTALSIVFAAKSFVRREDITSGNTSYYLAGTLLNFTYSVAIGLGVLWLERGL